MSIFSALFFTLLLEVPFIMFSVKGYNRSYVFCVALLVNIITNLTLNLFLYVDERLIFLIPLFEIIIVFAESVVYRRAFPLISSGRVFLISLLSNVLSYGFGLVMLFVL